MASFADELSADMAAAVGDYDQTFELGGVTYPCVRTTAAAAMTVGPGGFQEHASDRIVVALPDLKGAVPKYGDLIDKGALQITKIDPNVGQWILWCEDPRTMMEGGNDA